MTLWVLRHGQAQVRAPRDELRELTDEGREQVRRSAAHLATQPISRILVSPYLRAQQTADVVIKALNYQGPIQTVPWLTPDTRLGEALAELDAYEGQTVLLVSHQPLVGELTGLLVHGSRDQALPMHTASLAELEGHIWAVGSMTLASIRHVI